MPIFARFEKLQKYYLGEPVMPEEFKLGKLIIIGEYENQEQCETGFLYRWTLLTDDYICEDFNKYQKYILEQSSDGVSYQPVVPEQTKKGNLIQSNSYDCIELGEYDFGIKLYNVKSSGNFQIYKLNENGTRTQNEYPYTPNSDGFKIMVLKDYKFGFSFGIDTEMGQDYLYEIIGLDTYNTSSIRDMSGMFSDCPLLQSLDLSHFNTSQVTSMQCMFYNCYTIKDLDISNFDTSKVENMARMFELNYNLTNLNLGNLDTSQLKYMYKMFKDCVALETIDLGSFNTSNIYNMSGLFYNCKSLKNVNLSSFDVTKVENMEEMFYENNSIVTLDLSSFTTTNLTNTNGMFYDCSSLETIYMDNFDMTNCRIYAYMFAYCTSLKNIRCKRSFYDWCVDKRFTNVFTDVNFETLNFDIID